MRRIRVLTTALAALILLGASSIAMPGQAAASTASWSQYHYGATKTGYNPRETILNKSNVGSLKVVWQTDLVALINSSPIVADGQVFVQDDNANVFALRLGDGHVNWSASLGISSEESAPAVWGDLLIGASDDGAGGGGALVALDVATGAVVWRTPLASPTWSATPTISGDSVFVTSGTDAGTTIYRIAARTGRVIWHHAQPMPTDRMLGSVAVSGESAVVGGSDGLVYCFNAANGKLRWKSQAFGTIDDFGIYGGVAIYDGVVYTATAGYTTALRLRDGHVLWHAAGGGTVVPAVGSSAVYIGDLFGTAMRSFSARTGRLRWTSPMLGADWGAPALANGVVYIVSDFDLEAYSASSGQLLFSYPVSSSEETTSAPAVVNGRVYVGSADGVVRAFGLR